MLVSRSPEIAKELDLFLMVPIDFIPPICTFKEWFPYLIVPDFEWESLIVFVAVLGLLSKAAD